MTESVIKNEIYLAGQQISKKDLRSCDVSVIGTHPLTAYLRRLSQFTGGDVTVYPTLSEMSRPANEIWYVLEPERYDPAELENTVRLCAEQRLGLICIVLLRNINSHPTVQKYAEMELLTEMDGELGAIRRVLSGYEDAKAVLLDRLMGAEFDDLGLREIAREAEEHSTVTVTQNMASRYLSALYIPDALTAILTVHWEGKGGNIYNASSFYFSEYQLRSEIYTMLARRGVRLRVSEEATETGYAALSNGKLRSLGYENVCGFRDALRYTLTAYLTSFDIQSDNIRDGYSGKLNILREIEKDMLREIDRICRTHGIKYFISYGTMLGAVRHGGFIPWDDDVDVAMLRSEFEKFRQIAPKELNEQFSYESHVNGNGYHYFFDRITAKNTYFASRYSDGYEMHKGISVDVFVVDNVPANPKAAYRFWKRLMRRRMIMNVRWKNTARKGKAYWLSKLLLPLLRLRSMDSYSRAYEKAVRKYEHKDTGRVMPASSDHKYRGTFPTETFSEVIPYRFDDVDTFIPAGYKDFLMAWYGANYMEMLPLSDQNPFHDYYRLDVGSHLQPDSGIHFDYMGELL